MRMWAAFLVLATASYADPVTFNYTGEVTYSHGIFASPVGSLVTGTFSYDSALVDSDPSALYDKFYSDSPAANQALDSAWAISINVGSGSATTGTNAKTSGTLHHLLEYWDNSSQDRFWLQAKGIANGDDITTIRVYDYLPNGAPDGIAVGSGNLDGTVNTSPIDVSLFNNTSGKSVYYAYDDVTGRYLGRVNFTLTSVTATGTPVPEPGTCAMLGLALASCAIYRRRRAA